METDDVKVHLELSVEEAATIAAALMIAKSTQGDADFHDRCLDLHYDLISEIGNAIVGIFPYGNYR
jgi:chemotaxis protein CheY-P-specific phosphatase CheC